MRTSLPDCSAGELAVLVRQHEVSPLEVVNAHFQRCCEVATLNAVVTVRHDGARAEANALEARMRRGDPVGPLAGVPFTVKDVIATSGDRTTCGSLLFAHRVTRTDATAVSRLRAAGAILLGKTNSSEFALHPETTNRVFGPTRNPWDLTRTPGGSSGGESAAVAAGCSAFGIGSDFGGSLRWPAHCTGTVTIRPSLGLVPSTGILPSMSPLDPPAPNTTSFLGRVQVMGPLARSVADLTLLLDIMAGPDGVDSTAVPARWHDQAMRDLTTLKIAWCTSEGTYPVRDDVAAGVHAAARHLASSGFTVEQYCPDAFSGADALYGHLRSLEGLEDIKALVGKRTHELSPHMAEAVANASVSTIPDLLRAGVEWDTARARMTAFFESHDLLLMPVASVPAHLLGADEIPVNGQDLSPWQILACSRVVSLFGLPSVVVPSGCSLEGLPIGIQVVGARFRDATALAVAEILERGLAGVLRPSSVIGRTGSTVGSRTGSGGTP